MSQNNTNTAYGATKTTPTLAPFRSQETGQPPVTFGKKTAGDLMNETTQYYTTKTNYYSGSTTPARLPNDDSGKFFFLKKN